MPTLALLRELSCGEVMLVSHLVSPIVAVMLMPAYHRAPLRGLHGHCMTPACTAAQVQRLCQGVTEAPPAPGAEQDAFFGQQRHILARMVRDVLTTGDVPAIIADIMPAIVQVRLHGTVVMWLAKVNHGPSSILQFSCHAG